MVSLEEFKRLELRVARIKDVQDHPDAEKLYVITIDLGQGTKQIVAGIKKSYTRESLLGRLVVVIDNLEPVLLRGVESQGMLLASSDENGISVISPDREVSLGSIVK